MSLTLVHYYLDHSKPLDYLQVLTLKIRKLASTIFHPFTYFFSPSGLSLNHYPRGKQLCQLDRAQWFCAVLFAFGLTGSSFRVSKNTFARPFYPHSFGDNLSCIYSASDRFWYSSFNVTIVRCLKRFQENLYTLSFALVLKVLFV